MVRKAKTKIAATGPFQKVLISTVPRGRKGKHHDVVAEILDDVVNLQDGVALKVPLDAFGTTKVANIRAALSRATRQRELPLATSTDGTHLYIWREDQRNGAQ